MYIKNLVEKDLFPGSFPVRVEYNRRNSFKYPAHWHKAIEVVYAAKADSDIIINNNQYSVKEGDLVFIAGGDVHSYPLSEGGERVFILFDLVDLDRNNLWRDEYALLSKSVLIKKSSNKELHSRIIEHIKAILAEAADIKHGSRLVFLARIYDLVAIIIQNTNAYEQLKGNAKKDLLYKIGHVVEYIKENYMEQITLKSVAEAAGFSEHYISRIFNQAMGITYRLYLNKVRIKHAEDMLILNEDSISEIAFNCGFNSIPTFNRVFRDLKGCTPIQYRKMHWDHITGRDGGFSG